MVKDRLTNRQREVLTFIRDNVESRGFPPTLRGIGTALDIRSPNGVICHLKALEKKGYISRDGNLSRGIKLLHDRKPNPCCDCAERLDKLAVSLVHLHDDIGLESHKRIQDSIMELLSIARGD